jgi:hypothetical protein
LKNTFQLILHNPIKYQKIIYFLETHLKKKKQQPNKPRILDNYTQLFIINYNIRLFLGKKQTSNPFYFPFSWILRFPHLPAAQIPPSPFSPISATTTFITYQNLLLSECKIIDW